MLTVKIVYRHGAERIVEGKQVEFLPDTGPNDNNRCLTIYPERESDPVVLVNHTDGPPDLPLGAPSYVQVWVMNEAGKTVGDYRI